MKSSGVKMKRRMVALVLGGACCFPVLSALAEEAQKEGGVGRRPALAPTRPLRHPYLLFEAKDIPTIRKRAENKER